MALKHYEESRGKVSRIQSRLNQTIDDIRNNRSYSEAGRRAEMAKATLAARKEADALKTAFLAERESRRESLEKRLFGLTAPTPTELTVLRDSRDRARTLKTAEDAALTMKLANQAADSYMSKAIVHVAAANGWHDVVNIYAATAPLGTRRALEELADIPSGRMTNIADTATFTVHAPKEIGAVTDHELETISRAHTSERGSGANHF
jgi:hypothetical protein